jgi:DNA-binding CsgD family transcriptional regulator
MTARSAHERTLAVIGDFYDAALDESLWPAALKNLADLTASQAASFWVLDSSGNPRLPTFIYINFDEESIQEYLNCMAPLDPTVRYLVGHPQQSIVHDGLLTNDRDEDSRAYYDWHERKVETRFRMVGQASVASGVQAGVALHRTRKAGGFEPRDIQRFTALHRHLQRALAIGFQLGSLRAMQQFGTDWLDRGNSAVVLLDERQGVIFANHAAEVLQSNADGIRLSAEGIRLARQQENHKLQSLIAQARSPIASPGLSAGGAMRASRFSGKLPYGILVGPVSKQSIALSLFRPAVCVVITDPDRQPSAPAERFQAVFGFTKAEARLAARLATGEELRRAAEQLEITYGTARQRLAQIFQKTDTRRQGQLIRLLLTTLGTD